jgi:formylglycine-generating enzyme required for sulfatase activity
LTRTPSSQALPVGAGGAHHARVQVPSFAAIPAGSFDYGDRYGEGTPDERPTRPCHVPAFALARTPVTAAEYLAYLEDAHLVSTPAPEWHSFPPQAGDGLWTDGGGTVRCEAAARDFPVVFVSWLGAGAYCRWLSGVIGATVRLPTEAEWQYAAAGTRQTRWALGNEFDRSAYVCTTSGPARTGERPASEFGLLDVTGNVFEWCLDLWHMPPGAPESAVRLPDSRVIKGGAFILRDPMNFRNAKRFSCFQASCVECIGFRPLCEDPSVGNPS